MKKLTAWLCILAMLLCLVSFVGCNKNRTPEGNEPTDGTQQGPSGPTEEELPGGPTGPAADVQGGNDPSISDTEW